MVKSGRGPPDRGRVTTSTQSSNQARSAGLREGEYADNYFGHDRQDIRLMLPSGTRRLLDVGCGAGTLGAVFRTERPGRYAAGVEGFPEAAAAARTRLDAVYEVDLNTFDGLPAEAGQFDAMTFGYVLEHLNDPERTLAALLPSLAPGGVIVISVPNINHWSVVAPLCILDTFQYEDAGLLDRTHINFFTLNAVSDMFDRLGLRAYAVNMTQPLELPDQAVPFIHRIAAATGDAMEAVARATAYQYLVGATLAGPLPAVSAAPVAPRIPTPGLDAVVPQGMRVVRLGADAPAGLPIDGPVLADLAAADASWPRAFVLDSVLGHTRSPERVLETLAATMRDDDVAVIGARNVRHWGILAPLLVHDEWSYRSEHLADHPQRLLTATSLRGHIEDAGLEVVAWEDDSVPMPAEHDVLLSALGGYVNIDGACARAALERRWMRVVVRRAGAPAA